MYWIFYSVQLFALSMLTVTDDITIYLLIAIGSDMFETNDYFLTSIFYAAFLKGDVSPSFDIGDPYRLPISLLSLFSSVS